MRTPHAAALAAALCLTAALSPAMMVDMPIPILIAQSDLIGIAEVTEAGTPMEMTLQPPGFGKPVKRWFRRFKVTMTKPIRCTAPGGKVPASVEILAMAPTPRKPGAPMIACGPSYPGLQTGQKYMLILTRLPGRSEYWLPAYPKNFIQATDRNRTRMAEVEQAADVDKWPWGKSVGGLQLALIPTRNQAYLAQTRTARDQPMTWRAYVNLTVALRNTSAKPVAVSAYGPDRFLSLSYTTADGSTHLVDLYQHLARRRMAPFDAAKHTRVLAAGGILCVAPHGAGGYGMGSQLETKEGPLTLQAGYEAKRDGETADGQKLWKGKLASGSAQVEVKKRTPRKR